MSDPAIAAAPDTVPSGPVESHPPSSAVESHPPPPSQAATTPAAAAAAAPPASDAGATTNAATELTTAQVEPPRDGPKQNAAFAAGSHAKGVCRAGHTLLSRHAPHGLWRCDDCNGHCGEVPGRAKRGPVQLTCDRCDYVRCRVCNDLYGDADAHATKKAADAAAAAASEAASQREEEARAANRKAKEARAATRDAEAKAAAQAATEEHHRRAKNYHDALEREQAAAQRERDAVAADKEARKKRDTEAEAARAGDQKYWVNRWENRDIPWTRFEQDVGVTVSHNLEKLAAGAPAPTTVNTAKELRRAPSVPAPPPKALVGCRVLVPLSGNSPSLDWFFRVGRCHVVGIEMDESAVAEVVGRIGTKCFRPRQTITLPNGAKCVRWHAPGADDNVCSLTLLQGDFFAIAPALLTAGAKGSEDDCGEGFDLIYDRASFVALPPVLREFYTERIARALKPAPVQEHVVAATDEARARDIATAFAKCQPAYRLPWCPAIMFETLCRGEEYRFDAASGKPIGPPFHCRPEDIPLYYAAEDGFDDTKLFRQPTARPVLAALDAMPKKLYTCDIYGVYRSVPRAPKPASVPKGDAGEAPEPNWPFEKPGDRHGKSPSKHVEYGDDAVLNGQGVPVLHKY